MIKDIVYNCLKNNENIKEEKRQALVNIVNIRIEKFDKLINKKIENSKTGGGK